MADKYYVRVKFEYGTDKDGELTPKNTGDILWNSMEYPEAVALQNLAVIPGYTLMITEAGKLPIEGMQENTGPMKNPPK